MTREVAADQKVVLKEIGSTVNRLGHCYTTKKAFGNDTARVQLDL